MSYPINYPTPQGANVQIFTDTGYQGANGTVRDWVKPQGASFVWFTLIGAGGNGNGTAGGGSGAVTNFMCPAFLIPDMLQVRVSGGGSGADTQVIYQQKNSTGYVLLSGVAASGTNGASAMTANAFSAMGFFQSIAGQNGSSSNVSASSTTYLSGGGASNSPSVAANYGYASTSINGYFMLQPIIVGCGGITSGSGGIGCGGGSSATRPGGGGLAVIITW